MTDQRICSDHLVHHPIYYGMLAFTNPVGICCHCSCGCQPDVKLVAKALETIIHPFPASVHMQVFHWTHELYPVGQDGLCDCGALLVWNEGGNLESAEAINEVKDVWR